MTGIPSAVTLPQQFDQSGQFDTDEFQAMKLGRLLENHLHNENLSRFVKGQPRHCPQSKVDFPCANPTQQPHVSLPATSAAQGFALSEAIEFALFKSGYPMQNVTCRCSESTIHLTGHVQRYFYLQIVIEIVRRLASGRRIANEIEVRCQPRESFDDADV